MSDEQHPRPWRVDPDGDEVWDAAGGCVFTLGPTEGYREQVLAALVGAMNAADARTPLAAVLAGLARGERP